MEPGPDRRADRLPTPKPNPVRRHPGLHHHHGRTPGHLCSVPVVRAAGPDEEGTQERDSEQDVGVHVVRNDRDDTRAGADTFVLLPADVDDGRGALDCEVRAAGEGTAGAGGSGCCAGRCAGA